MEGRTGTLKRKRRLGSVSVELDGGVPGESDYEDATGWLRKLGFLLRRGDGDWGVPSRGRGPRLRAAMARHIWDPRHRPRDARALDAHVRARDAGPVPSQTGCSPAVILHHQRTAVADTRQGSIMEVCCGFFGFDAGDAMKNRKRRTRCTPGPLKQNRSTRTASRGTSRAPQERNPISYSKHHHAARASTVAKGNGTRDHCALPKPTGVAWDGLAAMMPITDPQWEKDFMERLDRIESSDLLRPSSADGSTVLMFACEHRDALAMSLILVHLHLYELRNWMITKRNANGWNAAAT